MGRFGKVAAVFGFQILDVRCMPRWHDQHVTWVDRLNWDEDSYRVVSIYEACWFFAFENRAEHTVID